MGSQSTCLIKSWGEKSATSIVACSFSRLKDAQRSSGVADPPIHKSSIDLVKQLPIAQGEQFVAQNREEWASDTPCDYPARMSFRILRMSWRLRL